MASESSPVWILLKDRGLGGEAAFRIEIRIAQELEHEGIRARLWPRPRSIRRCSSTFRVGFAG